MSSKNNDRPRSIAVSSGEGFNLETDKRSDAIFAGWTSFMDA